MITDDGSDRIPDVEENLFLTEQNGGGLLNDDDDDDSLADSVREDLLTSAFHKDDQPTAEAIAAQKLIDDKAAADGGTPTKKNLFNEDDENNDDDGQEDLTEKDVDLFNKKLGTDFKTVQELKDSFKKEEVDSEFQKEEANYQALSNKVNLYERYIGMENEELVRQSFIAEAAGENKDVNSKEVIDEIEERIEGLKDLRSLDSTAKLLRTNLTNARDNAKTGVDQIEAKRNQAKADIAKTNKENLENSLLEIAQQGNFFGVTITNDDIKEVHKDITSQKFFDRVNKDQGLIARFALFVKYEDEISKKANGPTHSDGVKKAFDTFLGDSKDKSRSIATATGSASGDNMTELQKFLK